MHVFSSRFLALLFVTVFFSLSVLHGQSDSATPYTFRTIAGSGGNSSSANGTGTAASFFNPSAVAIDGSGNLYVADTGNNLIRKITSAGLVTTLAGTAGEVLTPGDTGDAAPFYCPQGIAVDSSGNVYVADVATTKISKTTPGGVVTILYVAETPPNGIPFRLRFYDPIGVTVDGSGNVYAADSYSSTILKITPAGVVSTVAGTAGVSGSEDGIGSAASFRSPEGIAVDASGNIYVADTYNGTIRKITPAGQVTTLAGDRYYRGSVDGTGTEAAFIAPRAVSVDSSGNLYVADSYSYGDRTSTIRKVTPAGAVTTLAGGTMGNIDGLGAAAKFNNALGVVADNSGNVYVADSGNHTIRLVTSSGLVTTFAGGGGTPGFVDGQGGAVRFNRPASVATDGAGNVLIADRDNHAIRRMSPSGTVTTATMVSDDLSGLAVDGTGNFYSIYGTCQIAKTTPSGVFTILAGSGDWGSEDGPSLSASFNHPSGLAVDSVGNVYVADQYNCTIRKISTTGEVSTLAGLAGHLGGSDGIGNSARFESPAGIALDAAGNLYVSDACAVRRITLAGVVTTLAGLGNQFGDADGTGSAARFMSTRAITVDGSGNVFVTDWHTIRKITPTGTVTTLGGKTGFADFSTGYGPAAHFSNPSGIAVDGLGQIYIADASYNSIVMGASVAIAAPADAVITITVE